MSVLPRDSFITRRANTTALAISWQETVEALSIDDGRSGSWHKPGRLEPWRRDVIDAMVNSDGEANRLKSLASCKKAAIPCEASGQQSRMKRKGVAAR
jgi:hypothetical protein